jgi:hypothetical protein
VSDFADAVPRALSLGTAGEGDRHAFIAANSWAARHEQVFALARA